MITSGQMIKQRKILFMIDKLQTGKRISILRKMIGLSQTALAEKLNISTQAVSKWETGLALPDIEILMELSWLFEVSINSILEGGENFVNSSTLLRAKLSSQIESIIKTKDDKKLISSLVPYFSEVELIELAKQIVTCNLDLKLTITASLNNKHKDSTISTKSLSENTLRELAPNISEVANIAVGNIPKSIKRISEYIICPQCGAKMDLVCEDSGMYFICQKQHKYNKAEIVDGVICFNCREIVGEEWSLSLRNYEHYLEWKKAPRNPKYNRGLPSGEIMWEQIAKQKPKVILDIASGMGGGVERYIKKIDWSCMLIFTDLSYRILSWDKQYFETIKANPFVDMVFIACDCANIPIKSDSIDMVLSCCGFESMRKKKMQGFAQTYRILKYGASAVYDMGIVEDQNSANSKKWIELICSLGWYGDQEIAEQLIDLKWWLNKCKEQGFTETESIKIYGELPAPDTNVFPFENEILQWMCNYIMISKK
jgi:transcriptional regulator with XRE-family HTH domain/SAM-dependent methyltransferase